MATTNDNRLTLLEESELPGGRDLRRGRTLAQDLHVQTPHYTVTIIAGVPDIRSYSTGSGRSFHTFLEAFNHFTRLNYQLHPNWARSWVAAVKKYPRQYYRGAPHPLFPLAWRVHPMEPDFVSANIHVVEFVHSLHHRGVDSLVVAGAWNDVDGFAAYMASRRNRDQHSLNGNHRCAPGVACGNGHWHKKRGTANQANAARRNAQRAGGDVRWHRLHDCPIGERNQARCLECGHYHPNVLPNHDQMLFMRRVDDVIEYRAVRPDEVAALAQQRLLQDVQGLAADDAQEFLFAGGARAAPDLGAQDPWWADDEGFPGGANPLAAAGGVVPALAGHIGLPLPGVVGGLADPGAGLLGGAPMLGAGLVAPAAAGHIVLPNPAPAAAANPAGAAPPAADPAAVIPPVANPAAVPPAANPAAGAAAPPVANPGAAAAPPVHPAPAMIPGPLANPPLHPAAAPGQQLVLPNLGGMQLTDFVRLYFLGHRDPALFLAMQVLVGRVLIFSHDRINGVGFFDRICDGIGDFLDNIPGFDSRQAITPLDGALCDTRKATTHCFFGHELWERSAGYCEVFIKAGFKTTREIEVSLSLYHILLADPSLTANVVRASDGGTFTGNAAFPSVVEAHVAKNHPLLYIALNLASSGIVTRTVSAYANYRWVGEMLAYVCSGVERQSLAGLFSHLN